MVRKGFLALGKLHSASDSEGPGHQLPWGTLHPFHVTNIDDTCHDTQCSQPPRWGFFGGHLWGGAWGVSGVETPPTPLVFIISSPIKQTESIQD